MSWKLCRKLWISQQTHQDRIRSFQKIDLFVQLTEELHALENTSVEIQTAYSMKNCFQ